MPRQAGPVTIDRERDACTAGTVHSVSANGWLQLIEQNPGHSAWYIERFRSMAAEGRDLDGEARFIDAMLPRRARVLDAGCGQGRVGGKLAELGHDVVGADIDPELVAAAAQAYPAVNWVVTDLAALDLAGAGPAGDGRTHEFDAVVCAGNVMTFLDPATRRSAIERLGVHLADRGRLVVGFGSGRGYEFDEFLADVATAGLREEVRLSSWDLRPFTPTSDFLVAVLVR